MQLSLSLRFWNSCACCVRRPPVVSCRVVLSAQWLRRHQRPPAATSSSCLRTLSGSRFPHLDRPEPPSNSPTHPTKKSLSRSELLSSLEPLGICLCLCLCMG